MLKECAICMGGVAGGFLLGPGAADRGRVDRLEIGEPGSAAGILLECRTGVPTFEMRSESGMRVHVTVGEDIEWTLGTSGEEGPALTVTTDSTGNARLRMGSGPEGQRVELQNQPGRVAAVNVYAGGTRTPALSLAAMGESPPANGLPGSQPAATITMWDGSRSSPAAFFRSTRGHPLDWRIGDPDGNPFLEGSAR